jgi:hypothetical protein
MSFYSYEDDFGAEMYPRSDYEKYIQRQEPPLAVTKSSSFGKPTAFVPRKEEKKEVVRSGSDIGYSREDIVFFAVMFLIVLNMMQYNMLQSSMMQRSSNP